MLTHRGVVYCKHGGAAAAQPLAVSAALSILQRGGSFIDAGIAASAVLAVIEPAASHLGGDAFLITHEASTRENLAFNGSGEAPHTADSEELRNGIPHHGYKAATVPGLVSTWFAAHERFGKVPMKEILATAIDYAENGFPANAGFVRRLRLHLQQYPDTDIFTNMGISHTIEIGDLIVQKDLAESLKLIANEGRSAFYTGEIAKKIIDATGGWINEKDLNSHQTRVLAPLKIEYKGFNVHGQPPPSQGIILMEELLLVGGLDLKGRYSNEH